MIARPINASITRVASTSLNPIDATAYQDIPASTAKQKYPFAQQNIIHAKTGVNTSTTETTIHANAHSSSQVSIVQLIMTTAIIICAR